MRPIAWIVQRLALALAPQHRLRSTTVVIRGLLLCLIIFAGLVAGLSLISFAIGLLIIVLELMGRLLIAVFTVVVFLAGLRILIQR
ncbi:hypothetical protein LBMAG53_22210 [Planctomycetota bacterium]|nr:hypothetical protein LBMAG53_22210 [Planctomycetota bacterium]